jgi:hypothetical protein
MLDITGRARRKNAQADQQPEAHSFGKLKVAVAADRSNRWQ